MNKVSIVAASMFLLVSAPVMAKDAAAPGGERPSFLKIFRPAATGGSASSKTLIGQTTQIIQGKFDERSKQFGDFLQKLHTRRDKMSAEGKDVSQLDKLLVIAEEKHTGVQVVIDQKNKDFSSVNFSGDSKAVANQISNGTEEIRQKFAELNKSVSNVVAEILNKTASTGTLPGGFAPVGKQTGGPDVAPPGFNK